MVPLPLKLDSVPPETVTSPTAKLDEDSLKVNVMVAVCEADRLVALDETAMVGAVVSATVLTVMVTVLLVSDPSALTLPAAAENTLLATRTTPLVVLLAVGVNKAV